MAELKYVDWDGLVYYDGKIKEYIQDRDENYVKMGGIISFADLPDPTYYNLHYIYKITDDFTSNSRFDKEGLIYKAGTWIQCIDVHDDASRYRYTIFNEDTIGGTADIDLSDYYTKKEVEEKIEEAISKIDVPEVNLDNYYTKSEVDDLLPDTNNFVDKDYVDELFEQVVTEGELNTLTNTVAEVQETIEELSQQVETLDFVTPEELEQAISNIEHPTIDLEGYATEEWVNTQGFLKEHQDLSEYAKKSDIPQPELFVVDFSTPDFSAALEAYKNGKLLILTNAAPDADSYAVMNYIRDDMITFTKFLISRSGTYGSFNTYYLHSDNTWELAKEVKLNKVDAVVDDNNDITGLTIGKNTYDFDNFATSETVNQITENIENNYVSNTTLEEKKYVTEEHVTATYITIQEAAQTYVTTQEVTEVIETQVNDVVTKEIETKVETVIQEKVDNGEITVNADAINYDTW